MIRLGIVGHEAAKFTPEKEQEAREFIRSFLNVRKPIEVISGKCHLGGIDIWAIEEAKALGIATLEFPPKVHSWETGYKPRNQLIALNSNLVLCVVVKELPPGYTGMRFAKCYHCNTTNHVKSGGCWTVKEALRLGRDGLVIEL